VVALKSVLADILMKQSRVVEMPNAAEVIIQLYHNGRGKFLQKSRFLDPDSEFRITVDATRLRYNILTKFIS
jgi:hypothetical protein